jgi:hypothetical protein
MPHMWGAVTARTALAARAASAALPPLRSTSAPAWAASWSAAATIAVEACTVVNGASTSGIAGKLRP